MTDWTSTPAAERASALRSLCRTLGARPIRFDRIVRGLAVLLELHDGAWIGDVVDVEPGKGLDVRLWGTDRVRSVALSRIRDLWLVPVDVSPGDRGGIEGRQGRCESLT